MPPDLAELVVCPETLGPLEPAEGGFWSPQARRLYRYERDLVFMGYPERDHAMISATMEEEGHDQALGAQTAATNLAYLRRRAPGAVDFVNAVAPFVSADGRPPRTLELGCGNGWFSWLLSEAGFDVWMCDFEANTLATGRDLVHPRQGPGRRFVTDARYAPVASGSMDLVVFKEFVHHVADHRALLREAGRVLRPGGIMAFQEPVRSVARSIWEMRNPDPKGGHHITWLDLYLRSIRAAGLEVIHQRPVYEDHGNTRAVSAAMKRRAVAAIDDRRPSGDWVTKLHLRLFGGAQALVVARKAREVPVTPRPPMRMIDPATLVVSDAVVDAYAEFPAVLGEAAARLRHVPAGA